MTRPLIGICAALEQARWSVWDLPALLVPRDYVSAVQRAGARATILPVDPRASAEGDSAGDAKEVAEILLPLDGLMLAGGADIDPSSYGEPPHPETSDTVPERDAFELALTRAAIARGLPVLGICRGMQLINVALGGTLHQHLPERYGHPDHRRVVGSFDGASHDVLLEQDSLAARAAGEVVHGISSHHHQGVQRLGEHLRVSGHSALDDLPEAIEWADHDAAERFVLGVQWHPEVDLHSSVISTFVDAARAHTRAGAIRT